MQDDAGACLPGGAALVPVPLAVLPSNWLRRFWLPPQGRPALLGGYLGRRLDVQGEVEQLLASAAVHELR